jgi:hypothetical protein
MWTATAAANFTSSTDVTGGFTASPGGVKGACAAAAYSGVVAIGATNTANGTGANPSIAVTTQDPNNVVVAGFGSQGTAVATAFAGTNFRWAAASSQGGASTNAGGALTDVFDGSAFVSGWNKQLTGTVAVPTPTVSAPVDDGAGWLYIGGSDSRVHQLDVATGTDQKQMTVSAQTVTVGDVTFNWDLNRIHVGASDGRVHTFGVPFP